MLEILDMPKGGGADRGREVWFTLTTEDGREHSFRIGHERMDLLIRGLRHFDEQAALLRRENGAADAPPPPAVAERVRSRMTPAGDMEVAVGLKQLEILQFVIPRAGVKAMLNELIATFNRSAARSRPSEAGLN